MLLERDAELGAFEALLDDLPSSGGRVVLVRGEAGIGKTTLVSELAARHADTTHVLVGACDDLLTPQTLAPLWDLARDEPSIATALSQDDPRLAREALLDLLSRSLRPTLVIIEDTQWADEATLDAIRYLGRRIDRANGLLVLTYRDSEVDTDHPLRQVIGDLPPRSMVRMHLDRLSSDAIAALIGDVDLDLAEVVAQTDGNPLYVRELIAWGSSDVPSSVQDVVISRAARTSVTTRQLLDLVSVVPGGAERWLIAAVDADALGGVLEGRRVGLLRADDRSIGFVHELQRRAVESAIAPDRRRSLNRRVLDALEETGDPGRLSHHAREAGDLNAVLKFAPVAARAAIAANDNRSAIDHFTAVLPHLERLEAKEAAGVLYDLAEAELHADMADASLEHAGAAVERLRDTGDDLLLARALVLQARIMYLHLLTEPALRCAEEAVAVTEAHSDTVEHARALWTLGYTTWLFYEEPERAIPIVDRALEVARAAGDAQATIEAMTTKGNIEYSVGIPGGMELVESAWELAVASGHRWREVACLQNIGGMAGDFRNMGVAVDYVRRAIETAARYEQRELELGSWGMYAEFLLWLGRWEEAEDAATNALDTHAYTEAVSWRVLGTIQARRGRRDARSAITRMWDIAGGSQALTSSDPAAGAVAEYLWLSGDRDEELLTALDEILAFGMRVGNPWPSGALAFWMWKLGRLPSIPEGSFDMYMWIPKGRIDEAAAFWHERGIGYEEALALMHGDADQQAAALRIAEDLGADALAARIREAMTAAGLTVPRGRGRATRGNAAGLTARQAEVLELLAEDLSNAEIADRLFLSPRTVENHVAAVLLKLDVPGREQAVEAARERGLLGDGEPLPTS